MSRALRFCPSAPVSRQAAVDAWLLDTHEVVVTKREIHRYPVWQRASVARTIVEIALLPVTWGFLVFWENQEGDAWSRFFPTEAEAQAAYRQPLHRGEFASMDEVAVDQSGGVRIWGRQIGWREPDRREADMSRAWEDVRARPVNWHGMWGRAERDLRILREQEREEVQRWAA